VAAGSLCPECPVAYDLAAGSIHGQRRSELRLPTVAAIDREDEWRATGLRQAHVDAPPPWHMGLSHRPRGIQSLDGNRRVLPAVATAAAFAVPALAIATFSLTRPRGGAFFSRAL